QGTIIANREIRHEAKKHRAPYCYVLPPRRPWPLQQATTRTSQPRWSCHSVSTRQFLSKTGRSISFVHPAIEVDPARSREGGNRSCHRVSPRPTCVGPLTRAETR